MMERMQQYFNNRYPRNPAFQNQGFSNVNRNNRYQNYNRNNAFPNIGYNTFKRNNSFNQPYSNNRVHKHSANDRLNRYRTTLNKKLGPIKVHTVPLDEQRLPNASASNETVTPIPSPVQERLNVTKNSDHDHIETVVFQPPISKDSEIIDNVNNGHKDFSETLSDTFSVHNEIDSELQFPVQQSLNFNKEKEFDNSNNYEDMDWSDIKEEEVLLDIQELRKKSLNGENLLVPQTEVQKNIAVHLIEMPKNKTLMKKIYIVVDTNIFISHLNIIQHILKIKINDVVTPFIMIPWMVIQELDSLKEGRSGNKLKHKAYIAIQFINKSLSNRESFIKGQSIKDALQQDFSSKNPDDGILYCCLQIFQKGNKVVLLSNDVNLRNKVLLHGIVAYGHDTIIDELNPSPAKLRELTNPEVSCLIPYISHTFSYLIFRELRKAYGSTWHKMNNQMQSNPPWSLTECLKLFIQYWQAVFSIEIQKSFLKTCKNFSEHIKNIDETKLANDERSMNFVLEMCMYLKNGFPGDEKTIDECVSQIQQMHPQ